MIGVDESSDQVADARAACEREQVKVELHHAPLAELAFIRADTIDAVLSVWGLAPVDDIDRVFRQVDRVLRPEHPLVLSMPHPAFAMVDHADHERRVQRSYWDTAVAEGTVPRTISPAVHVARPGQLPRRHAPRARARRRAAAAAPPGTTTCATSPPPSSSAPRKQGI